MGLDMYLNGKRYLSKYFKKGDDDKSSAIFNLFPELQNLSHKFDDDNVVKEIVVEVGYWRKANQIHNWFVGNCQGGNDDCGYYHVGRGELEKLRLICKEILEDKSKASELLPPVNGFFFGNTTIDEYYFDDIKSTVEIIDQALSLPKEWVFEYHSSW